MDIIVVNFNGLIKYCFYILFYYYKGKKPFWINHLKLAELREIELNSYVQRLIKLPIQVSFI